MIKLSNRPCRYNGQRCAGVHVWRGEDDDKDQWKNFDTVRQHGRGKYANDDRALLVRWLDVEPGLGHLLHPPLRCPEEAIINSLLIMLLVLIYY